LTDSGCGGNFSNNISDYERNIKTDVQSDMLMKLATNLKVPIGYFFADEPFELDGLKLVLIEGFRALKTLEAKELSIKLIHDLQKFINNR
jgi:transcriptional regulator with XRE-family HTH domain